TSTGSSTVEPDQGASPSWRKIGNPLMVATKAHPSAFMVACVSGITTPFVRRVWPEWRAAERDFRGRPRSPRETHEIQPEGPGVRAGEVFDPWRIAGNLFGRIPRA